MHVHHEPKKKPAVTEVTAGFLVEGSQVLSRTDARKWVSEVQLAEILNKNRSRSWLVSSREIERWRQKAKSLGLLVLGKRLKLHPRKCRRLLASDPAFLTGWMIKDPLADVEA